MRSSILGRRGVIYQVLNMKMRYKNVVIAKLSTPDSYDHLIFYTLVRLMILDY